MFRTIFILFASILLPPDLRGQETELQVPVRIRAVLHDTLRPVASLYYQDRTGVVLPVKFRPHDLSEPMFMVPVEGSLVLYDKAAIDPENPWTGVAASVRLEAGIRQAMVVVLPAGDDSKKTYRMVVINDSDNSFPFGESRVISLVAVKAGVQAGEHAVLIRPLSVNKIPLVRDVNDFNMAQTNFHYQHKDGSPVVFAERQLQFSDGCRRLFIIHATPGALQPVVTTIVDTFKGPTSERD